MKPDLTTALLNPSADLEQPQAQRADLRPAPTRIRCGVLKHRNQHAGRRMQQQSKLVRQEPMTTRAPAGEVQFEFLDPVLCVPAPRVMQVSLLRCDQLV